MHKPVLLKEVIEMLDPRENQNFIDCTLGNGGHSGEILKKTGPNGRLLGLDWDAAAVERAKLALGEFGERAVLINASYTEVKKIVQENNVQPIDGALLDLGLSSDQLESSGRGFTFQKNEPLDMRFSTDGKLTAETIVNEWSAAEIEKMLKENADESWAKAIATAIEMEREFKPIKTTFELSMLVNSVVHAKNKRINAATKTFQALRIAVNDEFGNIRRVLADLADIVQPGGKIAVITFHSIEDRIVKTYFKTESIDCHCPPESPICTCGHKAKFKILTKKPIIATAEEVRENPRARSAKLRVVDVVR
jgi:16S rRNA (cytosine1402-N4)-methyltransferase